MHEIGRIKQVQVQQASLKKGPRLQRYYDPAPLLVVERLRLSKGGVVGIRAEGEELVDVHNADHPTSGNTGGNGISIGFTSHYQAMRAHFDESLTDGIAGENILVESPHEISINDLKYGIAIQSETTGELTYLTHITVAAPCMAFSTFVLNACMPTMPIANEQLKEALQFLHNGRRGFYAMLAPQHAQRKLYIQAGDRVFILEKQ
jgi:hypothetical protein